MRAKTLDLQPMIRRLVWLGGGGGAGASHASAVEGALCRGLLAAGWQFGMHAMFNGRRTTVIPRRTTVTPRHPKTMFDPYPSFERLRNLRLGCFKARFPICFTAGAQERLPECRSQRRSLDWVWGTVVFVIYIYIEKQYIEYILSFIQEKERFQVDAQILLNS